MLKRIAWGLVGLVGVYTAAGFWLVPYLLQKEAVAFVQSRSTAVLSIDDASFNPYTFEVTLDGVKLTDPYGLQLLKLPHFYLNADLDAIADGLLKFGEIRLDGVKLQLAHFRNGRFSYEWLSELSASEPFRPASSPEAAYYYLIDAETVGLAGMTLDFNAHQVGMAALRIAEPVISVTRAMPFGMPEPKKETAQVQEETAPWRVDLAHLAIESGTVTFQDYNIPGAAYSVQDRIDITLDGISSAANTTLQYDVSMRLDGNGTLKGKGSLQHTPLVQKGTLAIDSLPLKPGASYLKRFSYLKLEGGTYSTDVNVTFESKASGNVLRIDSSHALRNLVLKDTRDDSLLLSLKEVRAVPVRFSLAPDALDIGTISVDALYVNVKHDADGGLNLATLVKKQERRQMPQADANATEPGRPFDVKVGKIVLRDNGADFSDTALPMPFSTSLHGFGGTLSGIASDQGGRSHVDLEGSVGTYGTLAVRGDFAPADPKRYTELELELRNLDLSAYTPYAAKFVGRKIDDGRLFLDLGYRIEQSNLQGKNGVKIRKIALGENVQSDEAVSLPLDLAVALLKDREGVIAIDLPVEGDLDNPDFKYGATVWKAVVNVLSNVATAPFRFLGSLLGIEGDKLEAVAFEAGSSVLLPTERETLDALSKGLRERPGIVLEVSGTYDGVSDPAALQRLKAEALLAQSAEKGKETDDAVRLEGLLAGDVDAKGLEEIRTRLHKEHPEEEAYRAYYRQTLMQRLTELQRVETAELAALAAARAESIAAYLKAGSVPAEQIARKEVAAAAASGEKWVQTPLGINTK